MAPERTGRGELAKLVADHVFIDVNRYVAAAIMDADGQSDHLRQDSRMPRPGLDDGLFVGPYHGIHVLHQFFINCRSLFFDLDIFP